MPDDFDMFDDDSLVPDWMRDTEDESSDEAAAPPQPPSAPVPPPSAPMDRAPWDAHPGDAPPPAAASTDAASPWQTLPGETPPASAAPVAGAPWDALPGDAPPSPPPGQDAPAYAAAPAPKPLDPDELSDAEADWMSDFGTGSADDAVPTADDDMSWLGDDLPAAAPAETAASAADLDDLFDDEFATLAADSTPAAGLDLDDLDDDFGALDDEFDALFGDEDTPAATPVPAPESTADDNFGALDDEFDALFGDDDMLTGSVALDEPERKPGTPTAAADFDALFGADDDTPEETPTPAAAEDADDDGFGDLFGDDEPAEEPAPQTPISAITALPSRGADIPPAVESASDDDDLDLSALDAEFDALFGNEETDEAPAPAMAPYEVAASIDTDGDESGAFDAEFDALFGDEEEDEAPAPQAEVAAPIATDDAESGALDTEFDALFGDEEEDEAPALQAEVAAPIATDDAESGALDTEFDALFGDEEEENEAPALAPQAEVTGFADTDDDDFFALDDADAAAAYAEAEDDDADEEDEEDAVPDWVTEAYTGDDSGADDSDDDDGDEEEEEDAVPDWLRAAAPAPEASAADEDDDDFGFSFDDDEDDNEVMPAWVKAQTGQLTTPDEDKEDENIPDWLRAASAADAEAAQTGDQAGDENEDEEDEVVPDWLAAAASADDEDEDDDLDDDEAEEEEDEAVPDWVTEAAALADDEDEEEDEAYLVEDDDDEDEEEVVPDWVHEPDATQEEHEIPEGMTYEEWDAYMDAREEAARQPPPPPEGPPGWEEPAKPTASESEQSSDWTLGSLKTDDSDAPEWAKGFDQADADPFTKPFGASAPTPEIPADEPVGDRPEWLAGSGVGTGEEDWTALFGGEPPAAEKPEPRSESGIRRLSGDASSGTTPPPTTSTGDDDLDALDAEFDAVFGDDDEDTPSDTPPPTASTDDDDLDVLDAEFDAVFGDDDEDTPSDAPPPTASTGDDDLDALDAEFDAVFGDDDGGTDDEPGKTLDWLTDAAPEDTTPPEAPASTDDDFDAQFGDSDEDDDDFAEDEDENDDGDTDDEPAVEPGDVPDWLTESAPQDAVPEPQSEQNEDADDDFDALFGNNDDSDTDDDELGGAPDWLTESAPQDAVPEPQSEQNEDDFDTLFGGDNGDNDIDDEPAVEPGDVPDWLTESAPQDAVPEPQSEQNDDDFDTRFGGEGGDNDIDDEPAVEPGDVPDWLAEAAPQEPSDAELDEDISALDAEFDALLDAAAEGAAGEADDMPDWLAEAAPTDAGASDQPESQPYATPDIDDLMPDFADMLAPEESEASIEPGVMPDWMREATADARMDEPQDIPFPDIELDQTMPQETQFDIAAAQPDSQDESPADEDFVERFDFVESVEPGAPDDEPVELAEPATPTPSDLGAGTPDWLREDTSDVDWPGMDDVDASGAAQGLEEPVIVAGEDDLDWLSDISADDLDRDVFEPEPEPEPALEPEPEETEDTLHTDALDSAAIDDLLKTSALVPVDSQLPAVREADKEDFDALFAALGDEPTPDAARATDDDVLIPDKGTGMLRDLLNEGKLDEPAAALESLFDDDIDFEGAELDMPEPEPALDDDAPAWLREAAPPAEKTADETAEPESAAAKDEQLPETAPRFGERRRRRRGLFGRWRKKHAEEAAAPTPTAESDEYVDITPAEAPSGPQPEWVAEMRPTDLPVTVKAGGAELNVRQTQIDDLPAHLRAFRDSTITELVLPDAPEPSDKGPLAGVNGVLPFTDAMLPVDVEHTAITGLAVTPTQQARADRLQAVLDAVAAEEEEIEQTREDDFDQPALGLLEELEDEEGEESVAAPKPEPKQRRQRGRRKFDRVVVMLLLLAALIAPFLTDKLHLADDPESLAGDRLAVADAVDTVSEGDYVLFAFEYGPTAAGELDPLAEAVMRDVLSRNAIPLILSTDAAGAFHAEAVVDPLVDDALLLAARDQDETALEWGADYYILGYLSGEAVGVRSLRYLDQGTGAVPPPGVFQYDVRGNKTDLVLNDLAADVALLVVVGEESGDMRTWAEQLVDVPLLKVALVSAAIESLTTPYLHAEGYAGYLAGLRDTFSYNAERNALTRTPYIPPEDAPDIPYPEEGQWHSTALGAVAATLIIFLGLVINLLRGLGRRRSR